MAASWLTTVFGALVILGDIAAFIAHYMQDNPAPVTPEGWIMYVTALVSGVGLSLTKTFNVTNSRHPGEAKVVQTSTSSDAVKLSIVGLVCLLLAGCAGTSMFGAEAKSRLETAIDVAAAGTYDVQYVVRKNGAVLSTRTVTFVCVPSEGTLPRCTKQ